MNSPVFTGEAVTDLLIADEKMILKSSECANLSSSLIEKCESFAKDCEWILKESHRLKNYELLHQRYDLWLRLKAFVLKLLQNSV